MQRRLNIFVAFTSLVWLTHVGISTAAAPAPSPAATGTMLTSSANPSTYGSRVRFTASVSSAAGAPGTGSVSFYVDHAFVVTLALQNGSASLTVDLPRFA